MKTLSTNAGLTSDQVVRDIETLQIDKVAELLGKAACRKKTVSTNTDQLRPDAERLTVESAKGHFEKLEVRECAPFGRDPASELVRVKITGADVEHFE